MEHLLSVHRKFVALGAPALLDWLQESKCICSISNRNVIAFTSHTRLKDTGPKSSCLNIYVADLNVAFEPHKVTKYLEDVTMIEWDTTGTKLMIGDVTGIIEVWSIRDNILSEWFQESCHSAFPGEKVMTGLWFHPGIKIAISPDKKDAILPYSEKFTSVKFGASVRHFGAKPAEGFLAISSSGLVFAIVSLTDGSFVSGTEILGQFRSRLVAVDVCYAKNGHFLIITSNGCVESSINCYTVSIKVVNISSQDRSKCNIFCQPFSSFYLNIPDSNLPLETLSVTHLKFVLKEAAEAVIVATSGGTSGSTLELWELIEKPIILHKTFQTKTADVKTESDVKPSCEPKTVAVWQQHASDTHASRVVSVATPRLSVFDATPPPSYIIVAYSDNSIRCMFRENLRELSHLSLPNGHSAKIERDANKNQTFGSAGVRMSSSSLMTTVCDMKFTWSGSVLVVLDSMSQMYLLRIAPIIEPNASHISAGFAQTMFEYCLLSGDDFWDIILGLRPQLIDTICELLTAGFQKQPPSVQQKYLTRFHEMKGCLYRTLPAKSSSSLGQVKAGDAYATIMLNAVSTFLKSLLRARDNQEKEGPAENLSCLIQTKGKDFLNVDKVLMELEHKEFFIEPTVLQSLQSLNQWIADLTLYLLASLPLQIHNHYRFPGGTLIHEAKSINLLRELLVVIRIWGLINEACLPVFTRLSGELDVISHLFKLLTKRVSSLSSGEVDESLLDDCCLLPNQVLISQLDLTLKARGFASPCLFSNLTPFTNCYYYDEPSFLKYHIKTHIIDGAVVCNFNRRVDAVRHISLGPLNNESPFGSGDSRYQRHNNIRYCTRCTALSLVPSNPLSRYPSTRAWEQRFYRSCVCSGTWS